MVAIKVIYMNKPEIMSPAGYWPQLHTAIEAGADAVYFGLKHFTARAKVGFTLRELPEVMRTLHQRGVRGYVTFNTLIFDHELSEAAKAITEIAKAGADAIIVQDVGMAQLARRLAPTLEVHGSTQMSLTSAEGIKLAQQFGVSRVVLARELSLTDIRTIRGQTDCELEMFVHGALCVSYSGQCFSSEAWGGRSANRGQCAQACRLPYELLVDEQLKPLGEARYLLSPQDLYVLHQIPEIVQLGISALKIEGRYKEADYVALTTQAYRKAVDEAWAGLPLSVTPIEEMQLEQVYSRGLGAHFVSGTNHQTVVNGRAPRHRGVLMGRVTRVLPDRVVIETETSPPAPLLLGDGRQKTSPPAPLLLGEGRQAKLPPLSQGGAGGGYALKPGDGVVFDAANWRSPEEAEEGGRIYHVTPYPPLTPPPESGGGKGEVALEFGNGAINFGRIRAGDLVWRSHDPDLAKVARPFIEPAAPVHKQPVHVHVTAHEGEPLRLTWALVAHPNVTVTVQSPEPLGKAQNRALSLELLQEQVGRLGNTAYQLSQLELDLRGQPFAPTSLLNNLRRQATEQLAELQSQPQPVTVHEPRAVLAAALAEVALHPLGEGQGVRAQLHLLVRTPEQLAAAIALRPASITLDYLELYGLRPAVEEIQASGLVARVASPRILKPSEQNVIRFLLKLNCQILVRSTGLLQALQAETTPPLIGDFSLNAANVLTADSFLRLGLSRITPTHDLNAAQMVTLAEGIGADNMEVVVYQHLPVFHTEHCVFCRFLSKGTSYKDCGHPCEKHRLALRDKQGRAHPVMADVGCRNTVFGAEAQEASRHLADLQGAGLTHFRLEFVHESAEQVRQISQAFQKALHGQVGYAELTRQLSRLAPQNTTEGSLFVPDNYLALPMI